MGSSVSEWSTLGSHWGGEEGGEGWGWGGREWKEVGGEGEGGGGGVNEPRWLNQTLFQGILPAFFNFFFSDRGNRKAK